MCTSELTVVLDVQVPSKQRLGITRCVLCSLHCVAMFQCCSCGSVLCSLFVHQCCMYQPVQQHPSPFVNADVANHASQIIDTTQQHLCMLVWLLLISSLSLYQK